MTRDQAKSGWEVGLLALVIWREARGEALLTTKQAVAWSIRNRVLRPGWWGKDWESVILMPFQYSSFNRNDPNSTKFPIPGPVWDDCLTAAGQVYTADIPDLTLGADSYFDMSLDTHPPDWATDGSKEHTGDWGRLHFYRTLR